MATTAPHNSDIQVIDKTGKMLYLTSADVLARAQLVEGDLKSHVALFDATEIKAVDSNGIVLPFVVLVIPAIIVCDMTQTLACLGFKTVSPASPCIGISGLIIGFREYLMMLRDTKTKLTNPYVSTCRAKAEQPSRYTQLVLSDSCLLGRACIGCMQTKPS
jgi:hypothetical protein